MEKAAILTRIKETERKVEQSKMKALEQKEKIIKDSKREVLKIKDEATLEAQKSYDHRENQMKAEVESVRKELLEEGEKRAREFKQKAELNSSLAVDLLVKKFEQEVG